MDRHLMPPAPCGMHPRDRPVPDTAMDYDAIFARGGRCCGDEDFALYVFRCCGSVRLVCYEDDIVFLDPADLTTRQSYFVSDRSRARCPGCGAPLRPGEPFAAIATWVQASVSEWAWAISPDAWPAGFGHDRSG